MAVRRVFVIWTNPLFHESVRMLLNHPDIVWVGATSDRLAVQDQILNLRPDTIIIEEGESSDASAEALEILEASSTDIRVIRLSLTDNELKIYHREQRTMGQADDLLHLIQNS